MIQVLPKTARAPKAARACQNHEKQLETENGLAALGSIVINTLRIVSPRNKNYINRTQYEVSSSTHASREFIRNCEFFILLTTSPTEGNKHSR
jgi:hypothetical protein